MIGDLPYYMHRHTIPAALALLPASMSSDGARAMLLAIGLQESRFKYRIQVPNGPAHGFWQFERGGGVRGVLRHPTTKPIILPILDTFCYKDTEAACYAGIVHNDVLACIFARLLLWTVPGRLPSREEEGLAWSQYIEGWRPGKPHRETWCALYDEAWRVVLSE